VTLAEISHETALKQNHFKYAHVSKTVYTIILIQMQPFSLRFEVFTFNIDETEVILLFNAMLLCLLIGKRSQDVHLTVINDVHVLFTYDIDVIKRLALI